MTDNRKISIIVNLNKENEEDEFFTSLGRLRVPDGYQCEVIAIRGAANSVAAYCEGCRNNDAKYKVYIDSRVRILTDDFLCKSIELFQMHEKIAVIDVSGNRVIPTNGICITGRSRIGGYLSNNEDTFLQVDDEYMVAAAVDGFMFATQYDLSWNRNTFVNDRLAITAQCVEYKKQGYMLAVVGQETPCITLKNTEFLIDEDERNKFLDIYSESIYPKVLIGITTYNRPEYVQVALKSAMAQTYRNIEIVITDDSTNDETAKLIPKYLEMDKRIKYFKHENFTGMDNGVWLIRYIKESPVEYFNYLMDDDMLYPTKLEKMMTYYLEYEDIALVTSYRHIIDGNGTVCPNGEYTRQVFTQDAIMSGNDAGREMLTKCWNFVGEFSTTLVKKSLLRDDVLFGMIDHIDFNMGLVDASTWLQLFTKGKLVYIAEPLSAFRIHGNQAQQSENIVRCCLLHWGRLIKFAIDNNVFLTDEISKRKALAHWFHVFYDYLLTKTKLVHTDGKYETMIYEAVGNFLTGLDVANVARQLYTGEQVLNDPLPLKMRVLDDE